MGIKKYLLIALGVFLAIVVLAVCISARFNFLSIIDEPYAFVEKFFNQWSLALSAAGTVILALSVFSFVYENRRREEREKQQAIQALHDEIHWNLTRIIKLRFELSERLRHLETYEKVPEVLKAPYELINVRVFEDMRIRGQLHWLEEIRMDVIFCYLLIHDYNRDACFKPYHLELLAELYKRYDTVIRGCEAKFKFLPHYIKEKYESKRPSGGRN